MGIIYKATCRTSKKSYVGQTVQSLNLRKLGHKTQAFTEKLKENKGAFHRAIVKYGWDDFEWETLFQVNDSMLNDYEARAIAFFGTICPNGYNILSQSTTTPSESVVRLRKRAEDRALPRRVYYFKSTKRRKEGYRCILADGRTREFAALRESMETKRTQAIAWLNEARIDSTLGRTDVQRRLARKLPHSRGLPSGVSPVICKAGQLRGYQYTSSQRRSAKKRSRRSFTKNGTMEANLADCLAHKLVSEVMVKVLSA